MPAKKTNKQYIKELKLVCKTKGRLIKAKEKYINQNTPIKHKCYICKHKWNAIPKDLLMGNGCPNCYKLNNPNKFTNQQYLDKVKELNKINGFNILPIENYKGTMIKIMHKCLECKNEWLVKPNAILRNTNCPKCAKNKLTSTLEEKLKIIPLEILKQYKIYNNLNERIRNQDKIKIKCLKCNSKKTIAFSQLKDTKCKKCKNINRTKEFIKKSSELFGDKLSYEKTDLTKGDYVTITCKEHGDFTTYVHNHKVAEHGCKKCAKLYLSDLYKSTTEDFIKKARKLHGDKYDYSKVDYIDSKHKVIIICNKHGEFKTKAGSHINSLNGCPKCSHHISKVESKLAKWLNKKGIVTELNRRDLLSNQKEIDIYLPDYKIGIEVNGIFWHSEKYSGQLSHVEKADLAFNNGIDLIQFWETEVLNKFSIVKSMIKHKLKMSSRYYARELICKEVFDKQVIKEFLDKNHIQGSLGCSVAFGLYNGEQLLSLITLQKPRFTKGDKYDWELIRYATKLNTCIVGGASKLIANFRRQYKGSIISYADNRYSVGNVYNELGFKYFGTSKPNYFYVKGLKTLSRYACQKHKLHKVLKNFDSNKSEHENMAANNYVRTYDAGNHIYVLT